MQQQILDFIRSRQRFAITSHQRPDGDSAGSVLALALALEQLGKTATVFNADPTPEAYRWIPGAGAVRIGNRLEGEWDGVIILECSSFERTGLHNLADYFTINIDHHPACPDYADLNWTDPSLAAVGLLVQQLIEKLGVTVTAEIASALYVTVLTDTGSFQHSNTAADTFLSAAQLVSQGADPADIARRVYQEEPLIKMQLLQRALDTLQLHWGGKIASISLSRRDMEETGCRNEHTEGFVHYPLSVRGVEAAVFLRQASDGSFRISMRSKGNCDVGAVARRLGGGGHSNAAGLTLETSRDEAWSTILQALQEAMGNPAAISQDPSSNEALS